jgi:Asp-tRNA(Asn)/Glu-tRNA(Gln) amidotransferase A subunit family amidase
MDLLMLFKDHLAAEDGQCVSNVRKAGSVFWPGANTLEFGAGGNTTHRVYAQRRYIS